jgi:hypothetical protein
MTSDSLAAYLDGRGIAVKRHGASAFRVSCPVHDDPSPSVDWKDGDDRILLTCRAGCDTRAVMEEWSLSLADLYFDDAKRPERTAPAPTTKPLPANAEATLRANVDRLAADKPMLARLNRWRAWDDPDRLRSLGVGLAERGGRLTFPVRDEDGSLVGMTEYDADPSRAEGTPKVYSTGRRDLWPSPEFQREGDLWLVEGEGDAITALILGFNASGVPGAQWAKGKADYLSKRLQRRSRVYIVPDCDEPGRLAAQAVAAALASVGVETHIVDLDPSRSDGWDMTALRLDAGSDETARRFVEDRARHAPRIMATAATRADEAGWPRPMDGDAFHGLSRRVVDLLAPTVEADRVAILLHFLVAFGNACGPRPHMVLGRRRHGTVLYAVIVGRTAKARKGTAWAAVEEIMESASRDWYADRIASGLSSGEGLIFNVRDPITERIRKRDGEDEDEGDGDVDAEGFVERVVDPGVEDKRLLIVEQEFAQPLRLMRREGNPLSQYLRTLWDSGRAAAMTRHSPLKATGAHVSVLGHIVVEELQKEMHSVDWYNGFANRFLFACVRRSRPLPEPPIVDPLDIAALANEVAIAIRGAQDEANLLIFDPEAQALWNRVYVGELSVDRQGIVGAITARAEPYVARLSMIYALLDGSNLIRPYHLRAALAIWRYCDASVRFLFADAGSGDPDAEKLRSILGDFPQGATRDEIRLALNRNWGGKRIEDALAILKAAGLAVVVIEKQTGGRPAERWRLT